MKKNELKHFGVKGMKWGVWNEETAARYNKGEKVWNTPEERGYVNMENVKKVNSRHSKEDAAWLKDVTTNTKKYISNYNAAAQTANKYIIPALNKKWENVDIESDEVANSKYIEEYVDAFNAALNTVGEYSFYNSPSGELMVSFTTDKDLGLPALNIYSKNKDDIRSKKESDAYDRALNRFNNDLDKLSDEFYKKHNLPDDFDLGTDPKILAEYDDYILNQKYNEYMNEEYEKIR